MYKKLVQIILIILISCNPVFAEEAHQDDSSPGAQIKNELSEDDIISILGNQEAEPEMEIKENIVIKEEKVVDNKLDQEFQTLNNSGGDDKPASANVDVNYKNFATIRVLNKITTKSEEVVISKNKINQVGKLMITMAYCAESPSNLETENKAYLEIFEQMDNKDQAKIFAGWLFSSSPAISAVENPIYDIHLLRCLDK